MSQSEQLYIDGPAGRLEAIHEIPAGEPRAAALILHPHPLQEGTMHNKVAYMLARGFLQLGAAVLRFNFRGVGRSEGEYADAVGETEDALAALDWLRERWPDRELWLGGFSFGAQVALRAVNRRDIRHLVTVAPPVQRFHDASDAPAPPECDWLLIQGDADDVVDPAAVRDWAEGLAEPPHFVMLEGAGHFFHGRLNDLRGAVLEHFAARGVGN